MISQLSYESKLIRNGKQVGIYSDEEIKRNEIIFKRNKKIFRIFEFLKYFCISYGIYTNTLYLCILLSFLMVQFISQNNFYLLLVIKNYINFSYQMFVINLNISFDSCCQCFDNAWRKRPTCLCGREFCCIMYYGWNCYSKSDVDWTR